MYVVVMKNGCSVKAKQISIASHLIDGVSGHFKYSSNIHFLKAEHLSRCQIVV